MKNLFYIFAAATLTLAACDEEPFNPNEDKEGVEIGGLTWATRNVGEARAFVAAPEDYGNLYTFEEATTACPTDWRLPTQTELMSLANHDSNLWTTQNGVSGRRFGSGYVALFFPAAGFRGFSGFEEGQDSDGRYWSSTIGGGTVGYGMEFDSEGVDPSYRDNADYSLSVRCVKGELLESVAVSRILFGDGRIIMEIGGKQILMPTFFPENATNKIVFWSSSDPAIVEVEDGIVTAIAEGIATITVTTQDGEKTATCEVTVGKKPVPVTSAALSTASIYVPIGNSKQLAVSIRPVEATDKTITWSSSDTSIATIDPNGVVTGVAPGKVTITAQTSAAKIATTCSVAVGPLADLSVKIGVLTWATRNVGAAGEFVASTEDYGNYYTFQEAQTVCPDGWRVPKRDDYFDLFNNTDFINPVGTGWTSLNGVPGFRFGIGENTVFIPAAGYKDGAWDMGDQGVRGFYWTSSPTGQSSGYILNFMDNSLADEWKIFGFELPVRCVLDDSPPVDDDEVVVNGVTWATRNVGGARMFVDHPEDYGGYYRFEEAQTACPTGWRTPTVAEFQSLINSGSEWSIQGTVSGRRFGTGENTVFLPASGFSGGGNQGTRGAYWSSESYDNSFGTFGYSLGFSSSNSVNFAESSSTLTYTVRCVRQ